MRSDQLLRASGDIITRGKPGILLYPLFWPVIAVSTDFFSQHLIISLVVELYFIVVSKLRLNHAKKLKTLTAEHAERWLHMNALYVWMHPIVWGVLFAYSYIDPNAIFALLMTFASAGIVAGGTNSFAPDKKTAIGFVVAMLLPAIVVTAFVELQWQILLMLITYLGYSSRLALEQNKEYWRSLNNEQALAHQSLTDPLTQLHNRRHFDEKLDELCRIASRSNGTLSIMLVDCDHFKNINDTFGHPVGDKCLVYVANQLLSCLPRAIDVCTRYGGEEFGIILASSDLDGTTQLAERIRSNIEKGFVMAGDDRVTLTASIGTVTQTITSFDENLPQTLFKQADDALYQAKRDGRNRCVHRHFIDERENYFTHSQAPIAEDGDATINAAS